MNRYSINTARILFWKPITAQIVKELRKFTLSWKMKGDSCVHRSLAVNHTILIVTHPGPSYFI
jgi:hypothetical protein